ncbi:MAG: VCBS repeat-containing protein [Flavobacteriaceae bacterium]
MQDCSFRNVLRQKIFSALWLCFLLISFWAKAQSPALEYVGFDPHSLTQFQSFDGNTPGLTLNSNDGFGINVRLIGDLNGDGVIDLAVGASSDDADGSITDSGAIHIFLMNMDGSIQNIVEINGVNTPSLNLNGDDHFGGSIAAIGDLNNDGVPDLAVGAHEDDAGETNAGTVHILFMQTGGSVQSSVEINMLTVSGLNFNDHNYFGRRIIPLGDLNNDGVPDLAVGAYGDDSGGSSAGAVFVFMMNADGSVLSTTEINGANTPSLNLNSFDFFGVGVGGGDFNGDGIRDLAVGAMGDDIAGSLSGAIHILYLNSDGSVQNTVEINGLNTPSLDLNSLDLFGAEIASLGDLNGDGIPELLVAAFNDDAGGTDWGTVHILYMNSNGSVQSSAEINALTVPSLGLSSRIGFGGSLAALRDWNRDGRSPDVAIGATIDNITGAPLGAVRFLSSSFVIPEVAANTGALDNSNPLSIHLTDDTFTVTDGTALTLGDHVVVGNVPPGLTPVLTVSHSQTIATLTFTGLAIDHQNTDDISNLTFQFTDAAFSSSTATQVMHSGASTPYSVNMDIDFQDNTTRLDYVPFDFDYPEVSANDGSIDNSNTLAIQLTGDTYNVTDGQTLTLGAHVTVGNVPPGLMPVLTVSSGQTIVTLTFSGQAGSHLNSDDIANLTFQFNDSAFSSSLAAQVIRSGAATPFSSSVGIDFLDNANSELNLMRHGQYFSNGQRKRIKF